MVEMGVATETTKHWEASVGVVVQELVEATRTEAVEGATQEETAQGQIAPLAEEVSTPMPMVPKHPVRMSAMEN